MDNRQKKFGTIGIMIGGLGLLLAIFHLWAGPFGDSSQTFDKVVSEKTLSLKQKTLEVLFNKEPQSASPVSNIGTDKIITIIAGLLGGIAIILSVLSFANHESPRFASGAAVIGISAILFQFIVFYAVIAIAIFIILMALSNLSL